MKVGAEMRIGLYQFPGSGDMEKNYKTIEKAVSQVASQKVRFLAFHECALTGYPPLEVPSVSEVDYAAAAKYKECLRRLSIEHSMYIAAGSIEKEEGRYYNSMLLFSPEGGADIYGKRALWGWDRDNFVPGSQQGIYEVDGIRMGIRICFEVRFPEFFRELYRENAELCLVSFCDISQTENKERYELIKAHLRTRAVENVFTVLSVNDISSFQTAPTAVIDPNGAVLLEMERNKEGILVYDYVRSEDSFGMLGRKRISDELVDGCP